MNTTTLIRRTGAGLGLALLLVGGCVTPQQRLAARLDEILTRLDDTGAVVAARVIELPGRRELYARDADAPFTPASNMKVPVSATLLDTFGLEHTFKTYLALDGDNVWIIGTGDPALGDPRIAQRRGSTSTGVFDAWAQALREHGVTRIAGDLVYYDGALDAQWLHPTWGESVLHWYGAPVTGLNFNDNCVDITVEPTELGRPARFEIMPPVRDATVINECVTDPNHAPTIEKLPGGNIYQLGGTCAKREALKSKPVENPGAFTADAFRTHLAGLGIEVAGAIRAAREPLGGAMPPPAASVIAVHETPLRDVLGRINTNSQNMFADAACKLAGQAWAAGQGRCGPGSWADGSAAIHAFLKRNGIDEAALVVADGSGLSVDNRVTARLMTDLFAVMFERPDRAAFVDSLAKGGINGTLEKRFAGYEGHVFAKTGMIGGVRALSGYVRTKHDEWLAFSIIYNRIPGSVEPYEALQDEAVKLLVAWPRIE